jgi:D-3-phosphoglycerate dehydrogenase
MRILFIGGRWARNVEKSEKLMELKKIAHVKISYETDQKILAEKAKDAEIIITGAPVTDQIISSAEKLMMIQTTSVGYDHIDVASASENGVIICNVAAANANSVAELVFGFIIDIARRISAHDRLMRAGGWERVNLEHQVQIRHKVLGIVGLGAIGSRVAQIGKNAFNMKVLAYDPYITNDRVDQFGAKLVDLHTLMIESDVVTIHVPLNRETHHLIGEKELSYLRKTAIFINTSRGPVVDEEALISILKERRISGAALDVFENEPLPIDNPLRTLDNVVIVPHIGSASDALKYMVEVAIENVLRVAKDLEPFRIMTPNTYYSSPKWKNR